MDAESVLAEVNAGHGPRWSLVRPLDGGFQTGAWLLADRSGRSAVLKWGPDRDWAPQVVRAATAVARVRAAGYPTPAWYAVGRTRGGGAYQVQEYVRGRALDTVDPRQATALIDVLERQAGLGPDPRRDWSAYVRNLLTDGWPALSYPVAAAGPAGRRFVAECERQLPAGPPANLPAADLVHGDFRPGNVLFEGGRVSGVVDIEALGCGTRAYDYATLLTAREVGAAARRAVIDAGRRVAGRAVLRWCFIAAAAELLGFMRRHGRPGADAAARQLHAVLAEIG
ncbi:aminoglycoside phosphotransferase family protein [Jiangella endophytica]|uniref:aminoglycoside phosphotransferase family protein n=1 Tax=Jiangella endophytica TaxID=1623398 RepID=UPI0013007298|nr:aminoglycoside phosphotransferase family protein [Jiangella endophytica]